MARLTTKQADLARKSWQERAETWRDKIRIAQIINRLNDCAEGKLEMTQTQLKASLALMSKVLPDLSASDNTTRSETVNPAELLERARKLMGDSAHDALAKEYLPPDENAVH